MGEIKKREYKYQLPADNGKPGDSFITNTNSVVIIGANGSGKSRLGAWMEITYPKSVYRIGAQRSLQFKGEITTKSYEKEKDTLFYGSVGSITKEKRERFDFDGKDRNPTYTLFKDFENILSLFIAKKNNENEDYISECKKRDNKNQPRNPIPSSVTDRFIRIWNEVFSHRVVSFFDSKVTTTFNNSEIDQIKYNGNQMSDGEKTVLYLITQCLVLPNNITIVIDEPGLHLHKSIMNKLWSAVEKERPDCLFIYITHDTRFAANHSFSDKIWVKSYDGSKWDYAKIDGNELPDELLLDILGNRKKVLFVEGKKGSLDYRLYSEIYRDYYIIPCGSCENVIRYTKAIRKNNDLLQDFECQGIIDRDFKSEGVIEKYKKDGIYTLEVAEVENLFIVKEVLEYVNKHENFESTENIEKSKQQLLSIFSYRINEQIAKAIVSEIKYRLSSIPIPEKETELESQLDDIKNAIDYENTKNSITRKFKDIENLRKYDEMLKAFNNKSLAKLIGKNFGKDNNDYCEFIIRSLNGDDRQEVINALKPYLPAEIPTDPNKEENLENRN